ncbi:MAG: DUF6580 family putative transport protein [Patescibacteria group bacterium]
MKKDNLYLFIILSVLALLARLIWHLPNFSPLASLLLFAGAYASQRKYWILPFLALILSDLALGLYAWQLMLTIYGSLALNLLFGLYLKKHGHWINVGSATLLSALTFFLITNLAVWQFSHWYAHSLTGLMLCFTLAIPFFFNTLLSNILYTGLLFAPVKIMTTIKNRQLATNK